MKHRWLHATCLIAALSVAACSGQDTATPTTDQATSATTTAEAKQANAPTASACRTVAADGDVSAIRRMLKVGTAAQAGPYVKPALTTLVELRTAGADVNLDPAVAAAMRTTSEQAAAIKRKLEGFPIVDRGEWTSMLAGVVTACTMAGVDMEPAPV